MVARKKRRSTNMRAGFDAIVAASRQCATFSLSVYCNGKIDHK
jgi:hypothetical protein